MESPAFAFVCSTLETLTGMSRLQTRGTVRILLRDAGLEPHAVTSGQLSVIIDRMLPAALRTRGIVNEAGVCDRLKEALAGAALPTPGFESPEEVLDRFSRK